MSKREMKNYGTCQEAFFKIENEPEEGEIVDEYDLIVSSDEELCLRQRIRELEAENEEIEQIAVISRSYVDKISHPRYDLESSCAAQVPSDAFSISSTELFTPKKRKRRKSRERKKKFCHRQHQHEEIIRHDVQQMPLKTRLKRSHCKRRQKLIAKKHKQIHSDRLMHKELNSGNISLESQDSSDASSFTDRDNYNKLKSKAKRTHNNKKRIRDTLRLAVGRNMNESRIPSKKSCLKDKLLNQESLKISSTKAINERHNFEEDFEIHNDNNDEDDDDDIQVIENEQDVQIVDENSTDSMEEKELRLIALKSAVLKKHMARKMRNAEAAYSPTDFDEIFPSGISYDDNKLNDLDIVDLEDSQTACATVSPDTSPQLMMLDDQDESQQMIDCKPIDMDIANSDSEGETIDSWSKGAEPAFSKNLEFQGFSNNLAYSFYTKDLPDLPPPPPGFDEYEDVPPPPSYHMLYNAEHQDMDLDKEESVEDQKQIEEKEKSSVEEKSRDFNKACIIPSIVQEKEEENEDNEEEEALRALLLSKLQSPKNQKKQISIDDTLMKNEVNEPNNCKKKPTEIILKEAVKRLKIHSQIEHCKEETSENIYNNNKCDSSNTVQKLKNRLDECKNQSQTINTDHTKDNTGKSLFAQKESEETSENINNNVCNEYTTISNSLNKTCSIDISDITRRLQKIKENVLSLTFNLSSQEHPSVLNSEKRFELTENVKESDQHLIENNSLVKIDSVNNELNTLTKKKTVKSNFDAIKNQTTFKVTIRNNTTFQSENNDITNTLNDVTYKEINTNNVSNNLSFKTSGDKESKVALSSERLPKITNKTTESNCKKKDQAVNPSTIANPIVNIKTTRPTYSLLHTAKIVKPNKVINNANYEINLRQIAEGSEFSLLKPSKCEKNNQSANLSDNSRLITSIDQVKHMCTVAPFVISVQNSSNESSGNELDEDYGSIYKPLYDYNDNASPLSLNLESPSRTPLRSNSPIEPMTYDGNKTTDLEASNLKAQVTSMQTGSINKSLKTNLEFQGRKANKTPLAVRHLPAAAQSEYRRLIHRMKLLENKRKFANIEENETETEVTMKQQRYSDLPNTEDHSKEKDKSDATNSALKSSLVKSVLLRNASNNSISALNTANETQTSNKSFSSSNSHKINVLQSYENLYAKFGAGIVNNLDKSLELVEEAKKAKIAKLKLETRLKELKAEMDVLQAKHREEQQKITRIYPSICTTNDIITSLKQKRSKVFKAALNLGKTLKGDVYRLNNKLKESISTKSKRLASEIKFVNSIKAQDITNIEDVINTKTTTDLQKDNNKKKNVEICKIRPSGENIDTEQNPNKENDCSQIVKEEVEQYNPEAPLNNKVGGNTEFQSLESTNLKNHDNNVGTYHLDTDIKKLKNADWELDSTKTLSSYISPLEHFRNINSNVDPNGVVCPYDLMGNCEDATCKYVHITAKANT